MLALAFIIGGPSSSSWQCSRRLQITAGAGSRHEGKVLHPNQYDPLGTNRAYVAAYDAALAAGQSATQGQNRRPRRRGSAPSNTSRRPPPPTQSQIKADEATSARPQVRHRRLVEGFAGGGQRLVAVAAPVARGDQSRDHRFFGSAAILRFISRNIASAASPRRWCSSGVMSGTSLCQDRGSRAVTIADLRGPSSLAGAGAFLAVVTTGSRSVAGGVVDCAAARPLLVGYRTGRLRPPPSPKPGGGRLFRPRPPGR